MDVVAVAQAFQGGLLVHFLTTTFDTKRNAAAPDDASVIDRLVKALTLGTTTGSELDRPRETIVPDVTTYANSHAGKQRPKPAADPIPRGRIGWKRALLCDPYGGAAGEGLWPQARGRWTHLSCPGWDDRGIRRPQRIWQDYDDSHAARAHPAVGRHRGRARLRDLPAGRSTPRWER